MDGVTKRPTGMRAFLVMWSGQLVSLLGSAMTGFALPIYIFGETERVQELALLGLAFMLPLIVFSPLAGSIVDRYSRKWMMILSDLAAGLTTIVVLLLVWTGELEIWHLYITNAINGTFQTLQWPAYSAAISVMIPKEQYGRAHGLSTLAGSGSNIFAPLLAGALLGFIGLEGILLIDVITFVAAIGTLLFVVVPDPPRTAEGQAGQGSIWRESAYGFVYIWKRPSLLGLQLVFFAGNFMMTLAFTALAALILYRTNQNAQVFSWVAAAGAVGGVAGGLLMSAWGGPRRRVNGVLLGWALSGLLGMTLMGVGPAWPVWAAAAFLGNLLGPIIDGSNQAIWQAKVAPDVQGRVFSVRRLIAWATVPLANLLVIPLTDGWLEPAMRAGGGLADRFGWLVGAGPGSGIALVFVFAGLLATLVGLSGYLFPAVRDAEERLPDHTELAPAEAAVATAPAPETEPLPAPESAFSD
ncbi:MAG: MFS transporter [Anaerolineales bacterium]|nr:MFS transporter [Anaerolineales bacterium]